MSVHQHVWRPLLLAVEINGHIDFPCGSLGSQIGFSCDCGARDVRWPNMVAVDGGGMTEEALTQLNREMQKPQS